VLVVAGSVVVGAAGAVVLVVVDGFVAFEVLHDVETIATAMAATTSRVLMPQECAQRGVIRKAYAKILRKSRVAPDRARREVVCLTVS
jgi:hypothetical protein